MPGFELEAWVGLFAPAGTPPAVIAQLNDATKKALATPEAKSAAEKFGVEIRYADPQGLASLVTRETEYWGNLIRTRKITAD